MAVDIVMPKLSDTMEEGRILKWLKKEGDFINKGDILAEVETDKADMDLEAFSSGILTKIMYKEGETVAVGAVIAKLGSEEAKEAKEMKKPAEPAPVSKEPSVTQAPPKAEPAREPERAQPEGEPCCTVPFDEEEQVEEPRPEAAEAGAPAEEPRAAAPKPQAEAKAKEEEMKISPAAKKLMEEQGVGVGPGLTGSGPGGRIVKEDVERFLQQRAGEKKPSTPAPSEKPAPEASEEAAVEVSRMRAAIAKRMTQSKQTIPHFYVTREVDMGEAVRLVDSLNRLVPEDRGVSYNDIIIKACAVGLKDHPELNAHITDKGLIQKSEINIGVVVALKVGLLVPVVHNADTLPVTEISARVKGMRQRVLKRESTQEDLSGGTFTVSNMGMFGVEEFSAIINPPQVAILAVAAVKDVPVVKEGNIVPGKMMKLTLSADHRAVDGVMVARYLQRVKELLEDPVVLVVQ